MWSAGIRQPTISIAVAIAVAVVIVPVVVIARAMELNGAFLELITRTVSSELQVISFGGDLFSVSGCKNEVAVHVAG